MLTTRSYGIALLTLVLCAWPTPRASAADAGAARPRAALVIGNAAYSAVTALKNSAYDAHDMCDALTELGYTVSCYVDVKDAREFKARIQDFAAALKPKSEVLFYYAGHAVQLKGENYLVPTSAKLRAETDVVRETVSLNYIMTQLLQAKHYLNIVILDACRSNPWADNPRGMSSGLAPITAIPRGTMVLYATAANDVSDDGEGRNGTLTKNLLANIKIPGLTVDEMFKRVSEGVQGDSAAAVGHTQTPALYTNFTGEFCFAGCIDKVARAELEKMQKANDEQLEKARQEKAELEAHNREVEAHNREMEARLAATVTSMNCDKTVLNDVGRCFSATPEQTLRAVTMTLMQRGFRIANSSIEAGYIDAMRSTDDPHDKKLTDVLSATVNVKPIPTTDHSVVTLTAIERTVLHDEFHHWGTLAIIPIPTSKEYKDVVKKEVNVTDSAFYGEFFDAVDRNLRSEASAGVAPAAQPAGAASGDATAAPGDTKDDAPATTNDEAARAVPVTLQTPAPLSTPADTDPGASGNGQTYSASVPQTRMALIQTLVQRGFIIQSVSAELGLINAVYALQDPKNESYSTDTALTASASPTSSPTIARVQITASEQRLLHRKPGSRIAAATFGYQPRDYENVVVKEGPVNDQGFYRDLLAGIDTNLRGGDAPKASHQQHFATTLENLLTAANDGLAQKGFTITKLDRNLGLILANRRTTAKEGHGWAANYVNVSVVVNSDDAGARLAASASESEAHSSLTSLYGISRRQMNALAGVLGSSACSTGDCSPDQMASLMATVSGGQNSEVISKEGPANAAFFSDLFSTVEQKLAHR
ncbi:MAG TPA: caspase family protein [Steroidobacteraceae bacterium]|jgi:hypothetical protein|nr:caspase family protein [Steroidobacteraceae bacterium]